MTFEHDVFISYAHLDNQALVEGQPGWIANFHRAFEIRVGQYLGRQPQIWRDPKLQGNDVFAETLVTKIRHSAVMISILSPRYVRSEWTRREVAEFLRGTEPGPTVGDKHRIFKILKTPVALDQHPEELQQLLGYEFFQVDPETGRPRELDQIFGPGAQREFWIKVDDVAQDLCNLLLQLQADRFAIEPGRDSAEKPPVFLAFTTSDAAEQREILRRDLLQHGYEVLPARPLGTGIQEVESAVRQDLRRSVMSVHLLGRRYGVVPEDGVESLPEIQQRLAAERSRESPLIRLIWMAQQLAISDERQNTFVGRLRSEADSGPDSDLLETPFEDLRSVVQNRLQARQAHKAAAQAKGESAARLTRLFLIYDQRDIYLIEPCLDFLFNSGVEILHPIFEGDETEMRECLEENLRLCNAVLIHYGSGNEVWLRRKLREIQKIAGLGRSEPIGPVAVLVAPPIRPEKRLFRTHEAILIRQLNGFSPAEFAPFMTLIGKGGKASGL